MNDEYRLNFFKHCKHIELQNLQIFSFNSARWRKFYFKKDFIQASRN